MYFENWKEFLFLFGAGFGVIWAISILLNKQNENKIISYLLIICSIWLLAGYYFFGGLYLIRPEFYGLHLPFIYLIGPLLLYYYRIIIIEDKKSFTNLIFHILPSITASLSILPYQFFSVEEKLIFLKQFLPRNYFLIFLVLNVGVKISILTYLSYILYENKSFLKKVSHSKVKSTILFIFIIIYLILLIGLSGFLFKNFFLIELSAILLPFILVFFYLLASYNPEILKGVKEEIKSIRYQNSKIKNLDVEGIINRMNELMEREKAFADEDISLISFASELEISSHQLSEILNETLKKNFNQFINEYRIQEAKRMLLEETSRNILSIAFSVGFNSKASFNRIFKQQTGITPVKYRSNYGIKL
jgi:AraC-like DNA-binding protein